MLPVTPTANTTGVPTEEPPSPADTTTPPTVTDRRASPDERVAAGAGRLLGATPPQNAPAAIAKPAVDGWGVAFMTQLRGADNTRTKLTLDWRPRYTTWRTGFARSWVKPRQTEQGRRAGAASRGVVAPAAGTNLGAGPQAVSAMAVSTGVGDTGATPPTRRFLPVMSDSPSRLAGMIHHTTFVMPDVASGLGYDVPFLVLGADTPEEAARIPLVTSLHRIHNSAMPFVHASPVLGEFPVTDAWATAVSQQYDDRAKVVLLRDPIPAGISTEYAELTKGVLGPNLPPWLGAMLEGAIRSAVRDVPVTAGTNPLSVGIDPTALTGSIEAWAHQLLPLT